MSDPETTYEPIQLPTPRGHALTAWIVILAVVGYLVWRTSMHANTSPLAGFGTAAGAKPSLLLFIVSSTILMIALLGLALLIVWCVLVATGQIRLRRRVVPHYGGLYAETFALWMLLFLGTSYAMTYLPLGRWRLLIGAGLELWTLGVLGWPVLRGASWQQVCADLGLHPGELPGQELLAGLGCYAAGMSVAFGMNVVVTVFQKALTGGVRPPVHPIVETVAQGDWLIRLQVVFAAVIVAPIVEEIMFRGLLFRHLREATWRWGRFASIGAAAVMSSFLFAVIHPQGWLGVLPLMMLAIVFSLAREWRGSLLPSMTAHAINNGVATIVVFVVLGT